MKTKLQKAKTKSVSIDHHALLAVSMTRPLCDLLAVKRSHASVTINSMAISLLVYLSWEKNTASTKVTKISSKVKNISSSTSLTGKKVLKGRYINKTTLQVATILVAMATRILELATKLERKSLACRLKLT